MSLPRVPDPAILFVAVLPRLRERSGARKRPLPPAVARAPSHSPRLSVADPTTLEAVFERVGTLRDVPGTVLGGKLMGLLYLPSKLPVGLWLDEDADVNEQGFLDRLKAVLTEGALLIVDKGSYSLSLFDWLTEHRRFFLTRARSFAAFDVSGALSDAPAVRDWVIALGKYRSIPCRHPVGLVEVRVGSDWHGYLTNVSDPTVLPKGGGDGVPRLVPFHVAHSRGGHRPGGVSRRSARSGYPLTTPRAPSARTSTPSSHTPNL